MGERYPTGYSASVRISLQCAGQTVPLTHSASTFVIAKSPVDLPAGDASIVVLVDDARYERPVRLVNGMSKSNREAMVLSRDSASPF